MKTLSILFAGVVLGYAVSSYTHKDPAPVPCHCDPCPKIASPPPSPPTAMASVPEAKTINPAEPSTATAQPPVRQLTITGELIAEMEDQWEDLPDQIRLARESGGWRVAFIEDDSVFIRAGFRQDDLITQNAVDALRTNTGDQNIAERFSRILEHVSTR